MNERDRGLRRPSLEGFLESSFISKDLKPIMFNYRDVCLIQVHTEGRSKEWIDHWFNLGKRSLSEMGLCWVWEQKRMQSLIPKGFTITAHTVFSKKDGLFSPISLDVHIYASRGSEVLCLTPGQFVRIGEQLRAGDRVGELHDRAPGLVRLYDEGLAVLHGDAEEIGEQLNLWYMRE